MTESLEHISWRGMRERCLNTNSPHYPKYGGAGITIDPSWDSFEQFRLDMGLRQENETLERIENNLGYSKANCRWATRQEQALNRGVYETNKSGVSGVRKVKGYWTARGTYKYKEYHLYCGPSYADAVEARLAWELEMGFTPK